MNFDHLIFLLKRGPLYHSDLLYVTMNYQHLILKTTYVSLEIKNILNSFLLV